MAVFDLRSVDEKEFAMSTNNPNRNRNQSADRNRMHHKQSGDQHIFPEDEPLLDPHRPHRMSREDMQKFTAPAPDTDEPQ
ncbi:hypothetical protein D3870_07145 [Noviherbaspirillum cavernae]|uniref:Uncharacterized protein n=1 Tax=Noviherbaspirillum cavernae TaxID=2320862 RepID=A0A418X0G0_9BURK|nr:hypothetical protein [Noviherbaspirillum cavernae]RJG05823.1 hypothetical protein D3870_07145 [Noviherbaspirillum cavernae]